MLMFSFKGSEIEGIKETFLHFFYKMSAIQHEIICEHAMACGKEC